MKTLCLLCALLFTIPSHAAPEPLQSTVPSSMLETGTLRGFSNAVTLANDRVRAIIIPDIGRVVHFALMDQASPLRADTGLLDRGQPGDGGEWKNFGGSWLWPATQSRWKEFCGRDWPPPPGTDDAIWQCSAWRQADGSSFCRLTATLGKPFLVRVTREFTLAPKALRLVMNQRIERTAESLVPMCLWNIAQVEAADEVVMPLDTGQGIVALGFTPLPKELVTKSDGAATITVSKGTEHKIGSTSPRSWIAARRGQTVLLMTAKPGDAAEPYGDGCRVEMYTNKGLGYTEIEATGPERLLRVGETVTNSVSLELYASPHPIAGAALATWCRQLAGEVPFPAAP